jgi:hypothetical protein
MNVRRFAFFNGPAQFWDWLSPFPNVRLAGLGLILILLYAGVLTAIEAAARPLFDYLTEPVKVPNWEVYWNAFLTTAWVVGIILMPVMFAGMTMIVFAGYRAVRDFVLRYR